MSEDAFTALNKAMSEATAAHIKSMQQQAEDAAKMLQAQCEQLVKDFFFTKEQTATDPKPSPP